MLDLQRERRALALFEAMLDMEEETRDTWLDSKTAGDTQLRERVSQFVHADTIASLRTSGAFAHADHIDPPDTIGNYRITGLIGSGGMGSVFAATRSKGDFDHDVAIKIIKPGILSESLVKRFEQERQILAGLNHPYIARLLDGGTAEDGLPYFVMERVDGISLNEWLDGNAGLAERLRLFGQICNAVSYAHRNLVVHRDLTPANVLVEATGNAKLIDFGIARPDGEALSDLARPLRALTLTPGYAAPERLEGKPATVSSDVYSAGRLLSHIVEGSRQTELRAIIDKAMSPNPDDRYHSMDELAEDVQRFQNSRTVKAMPYSRGYAFGKWLKRNRLPAALGALFVLALIGGLAASTWYAQRERVARAEADHRFDEVRSIATFMLYDLYDDLSPLSGNTRSLARIAEEARKYLERLSVGDDLSPELRLEIAQGYHRLSDVTGNPQGSNLGRREEARTYLDRALSDLRALHGEYPNDTRYTVALAEALYSDAILRFIGEDDNKGGSQSAARSAALYDEVARLRPNEASHRRNAIQSRLQAAKPLVWMDQGERGVRMLKAVQAEIGKFRKTNPTDREAERLAAAVASELGYSSSWHFELGSEGFMAGLASLDQAVSQYDRLIATARPEAADDLGQSLLTSLFNRSLVLSDLERWREAMRDLERAEAIAAKSVLRDPEDEGALRRRETIWSQKSYALIGLGRSGDAVNMAGQLVDARRKRAKREPENSGHARDLANAIQILGDAYEGAGQAQRACAVRREALSAWKGMNARSPLSAIDRENSLKPLEELVAACS